MGRTLAIVAVALSVAGCSAVQHREAVRGDDKATISVGVVQKEIRVGMSGAEVAGVLGAPNIVTTDEQRRETWIYDRIASERVYSRSSGGVLALVFGGGSPGGGLAGGLSVGAGAESSSQRTLTILIKFDEAGRVRDFAYHASSF